MRSLFAAFLVVLVLNSSLRSQDFSGDGRLDCDDVMILGAAIENGSGDLRFDLNDDGALSGEDMLDFVGESAFRAADMNFDGFIDRRDLAKFGLNWERRNVPLRDSHCVGDFNLDGRVDSADKGQFVHWHESVDDRPIPVPVAEFFQPPLTSKQEAWAEGQVIAESSSFELIVQPERAPEGLLANTLIVRAKNPDHSLALFDRVAITGAAHQVGIPGAFGVMPTPFGVGGAGLEGIGTWSDADSRMLIPQEQIGGGEEGGYAGINENNDQSQTISLPTINGLQPVTGIGGIQSFIPSSAFYLRRPWQTNEVALARIVTPANSDEGVFVRLGVIGGDLSGALVDDGIFGHDSPIAIPFFAQFCDFNDDGSCNQIDLEQLEAAVANAVEDESLNLDGSDPPLITAADIETWNHLANPIEGDTDFDGDVDAIDLNNLAVHWQINSAGSADSFVSWEQGDFSRDLNVDEVDLNMLAINWGVGVDEPAKPASVPEPSCRLMFLVALVCSLKLRACDVLHS